MITIETYANLPRKIGAHAFVILGLLQAARMESNRPVTAQWLFDHAPSYGKNTITNALRKLTDPEIQLAVRVQGGWIFNSDGAYQLPLGYALVDGQNSTNENIPQGENPSGREFENIEPAVVIDVDSQNPSERDFRNDKPDESIEKQVYFPQNPSGRDFGGVLRESRLDSLKDLKELKDSSLDSHEIENRKLLKNAYMLLGKEVTWNQSFAQLGRDEILAWLAHAFDNLGKFKHPYGFVFRGLRGELRRQKSPDQQYQANPLNYFPQNFLEACELVTYSCCGLEFTRRTDFEQHQAENHHEEPDMQKNDEESEPGPQQRPELIDPKVELAWKQGIDYLQLTPQAANYLEDAYPVYWDGEILTVAVGSQYAAEWLSERLTRIISNALGGILNCPADVVFVFNGVDHAKNIN